MIYFCEALAVPTLVDTLDSICHVEYTLYSLQEDVLASSLNGRDAPPATHPPPIHPRTLPALTYPFSPPFDITNTHPPSPHSSLTRITSTKKGNALSRSVVTCVKRTGIAGLVRSPPHRQHPGQRFRMRFVFPMTRKTTRLDANYRSCRAIRQLVTG